MLTLAGRLHKPVFYNVAGQNEDSQLKNMIQLNHRLALNVGLLTMIGQIPQSNTIPVDALYNSITRLSYAGDIRQTFAVENKYKVENIVKHNLEGFTEVYSPWMNNLIKITNGKCVSIENNLINVKFTPELIYKLCLPGNLPFGLQTHL